MKRLLISALLLTGCAANPPSAFTDVQLCVEGGRAHENNDTARFDAVVSEGAERIKAGRFTFDESVCSNYAQMGAKQVRESTARWQALGSFGATLLQQAAQ